MTEGATTEGVPTLYDYLSAARAVHDGSDPEAIARLARGRVAPPPKATPATVTPIAERREAQARQGGLGL